MDHCSWTRAEIAKYVVCGMWYQSHGRMEWITAPGLEQRLPSMWYVVCGTSRTAEWNGSLLLD